jgi:hypothetical protein
MAFSAWRAWSDAGGKYGGLVADRGEHDDD